MGKKLILWKADGDRRNGENEAAVECQQVAGGVCGRDLGEDISADGGDIIITLHRHTSNLPPR